VNPFAAAAWAGLISLDFIGFGPLMISQPMVCGPLFGWLLGDVAVGLLIGVIVQLLWMDVTAVGVGIPYDATATTLLAVYWGSLPVSPSLSQILLALVLAIPFGALFRRIDQFARRVNTQIMRRIDAVSDTRLSLSLSLGIATALGLAYLRYAGCYLAALWLGQECWEWIAYTPRMTLIDRGLTMSAILLPIAGLGVCLELLLSDEPNSRWRKKESA